MTGPAAVRSSGRTVRRQRMVVGLAVISGLALSAAAFRITQEAIHQRVVQEFHRSARDRIDKVHDLGNSSLEGLRSVRAFYRASKEVDRGEFRTFVQPLLQRYTHVRAFEWAPRVANSERPAVEASARAEGFPSFQIMETFDRGVMASAVSRPEYFPVLFVEPYALDEPVLGFDLASNAERWAVMAQARDSGRLTLTPALQSVQTDRQQLEVLSLLPIYRNGAPTETVEQRREHLVGFAVGVTLIDDLVREALREFSDQDITLYVSIPLTGQAGSLLYAYPPGAWVPADLGNPSVLTMAETVDVANQEWTLTCVGPPSFGRLGPWQSWAAFAAGLLFTCLLTAYLRALHSYGTKVERLVGDRTAELQARNEELAKQQQAMRGLLEDLHVAKERIEQQAATLQAANTKLKELAILKDEFVAKVSHELRTPLTSIKEGLSLLLDEALGTITADQRDFIQTMDGDVDRLTALINNMLDLSKIEAGRMRLIRGRVEMPQLIQSLTRSYQSIMGRRTVTTESAGPVPPVFGDQNRLLQILTNLLSNAIKFTPEDGRITFRLDLRDGMVAVAVDDNGTGVAASDLPKLFQKFSQVGSASSGAAASRGTGLGLVVCKELAELHGGTIEVASTLGQGTTFTVLLPAYTERLALTESFLEQLDAVNPADGQMAALIAIQASALVDPGGPADARRLRLEQAAQEVRQCLHRGDTVVTLDPSWVVVAAVTEASGLKAIVRRIQERVPDGRRLLFGAAVYPQDGLEAGQLFERAAARVSEHPPELQASAAPKPTTEPA